MIDKIFSVSNTFTALLINSVVALAIGAVMLHMGGAAIVIGLALMPFGVIGTVMGIVCVTDPKITETEEAEES